MEQFNRIQINLKDNEAYRATGDYNDKDKDIGKYKDNGNDVINKEEGNDSLHYDKNQGNWSMEDINHLIDRNNELGRQWRKIAMDFEGKSARQCAYMYDKISASGANKKFSRVDDIFLLDLVKVHGCNWHLIQRKMTKFSIVQLRNRYNKVLLSKLLNVNSKRKITINKLYKLKLKKKDNEGEKDKGLSQDTAKDKDKDKDKDIEMKNDINNSDAVTQCDYLLNQPKPYSSLNFSFSPIIDTNSNTHTIPSPIPITAKEPIEIQKSIMMRYNSNSNSNNRNISNSISNTINNNNQSNNEKTVNDNIMDNKDIMRKDLINTILALFNKLKVLLKILLNENRKMESKYQSPELKVFNTLLIQKMKRILLNYQRVMKERADFEEISKTMLELIKNQSKLIQLGKINSKLYRTLNGLFEALHSNLPE